MATEKRKIHRVVDANGTLVQVLPETSAEQVTIADAGNKFTSNNVEGALQELATGVADAGKVDDVRNNASDASTSIVTNKIADLSKAVVKEAGQVGHTLTIENGSHSVDFNGGTNTAVSLNAGYFASTTDTASGTNKLVLMLADSGVTAGTYQGLTVDEKGRVTAAEDKGYAVKANVDTELAKKLDKAGGSVTGNLTIGGNLTVNGTTTSIDSTTLKVSDKLIEVAKDNTVKLTTPAGIVVPKYDGTNYGALVIDGDGDAQVGDVKLDASGNIDVTNSDLQTLATRTGLTDGNLVKWDDTNKTLVPDTTVASNASSALSKANENATEIANIKNGTTKVKSAEHADTADSATNATNAANATNVTTNINGKAISSIFESNGMTVKNATNATNAKNAANAIAAMNVTTNINGHAISDIFESDGTTVKNTTNATNAEKAKTAAKVEGVLHIGAATSDDPTAIVNSSFNGSLDSRLQVTFEPGEFLGERDVYEGQGYRTVKRYIKLSPTGVTAGQYSAVNVDAKGRVTAGGKSIEWGTAGQTEPSGDLMVGGLFMELISQ